MPRSPEFFSDLATSLFTMFQVMTGDSWASSVSRSMFDDEGKTDHAVALFFVTYLFLASIVLLNVVVAVLLDEVLRRAARDAQRGRLPLARTGSRARQPLAHVICFKCRSTAPCVSR